MAGEVWSRFRDLMLGIDVARLHTAAQDWEKLTEALTKVQARLPGLTERFDAEGLIAEVSFPLAAHVEQIGSALDDAVRQLGRVEIPQGLDHLARYVRGDQEWVHQAIAAHPQELSGAPQLSADPAVRSRQEIVYLWADSWSEDRLNKLDSLMAVRASDDFDRFSPSWPDEVPRADPSASVPG